MAALLPARLSHSWAASENSVKALRRHGPDTRERTHILSLRSPPRQRRYETTYGDGMHDLRFAFRQLRNAPAFTITALATVAICLGANLAVFAVIDSILLRPLPFPESDRLVTIFNTYPGAGVQRDGSSLTNYYERRGNIPAFSSLSIFRDGTEVVGGTGAAEQTEIMRVSPDFFATLGVNLAMGRTFSEEEAAVAENN